MVEELIPRERKFLMLSLMLRKVCRARRNRMLEARVGRRARRPQVVNSRIQSSRVRKAC